ncbi:MAG: IS1595 family transposase [Planctomycetaceae bacterium]|nr:IS1595 family transposase [Planctomycetaceae bacterium]
MSNATPLPTTLLEAITYFSHPDTCHEFMSHLRWPDGAVKCPRCQCSKLGFVKTRRLWHCKGCQKQFSIKVGTIFEDSPLGLDKWLPAVWLIANCKNGISSHELARDLGVTQKSAWFMLHRIRLAMQSEGGGFMKNTVEADETFIGGKARNMHKGKRKVKGTGSTGKEIVMGLLERGEDGKTKSVRVKHIPNTKRMTIHAEVRANVYRGAELHTDSLASYTNLDPDYIHKFVDHAVAYVNGKVTTNGLENFWSLLKRALKGTYISVEPFHLFRYLDEQAFRFNNRTIKDFGRFAKVLQSIVGKRLEYAKLIGDTDGKTAAEPA